MSGHLGRPARSALLFAVAFVVAAAVSQAFGWTEGGWTYLIAAIAGGASGYIGGSLRDQWGPGSPS